MPFNRIAIYGHRGWASSATFAALVASGAPIEVLYRHGSDISTLADGMNAVEIDLVDQDQPIAVLQDIDIVMIMKTHLFPCRTSGLHNSMMK